MTIAGETFRARAAEMRDSGRQVLGMAENAASSLAAPGQTPEGLQASASQLTRYVITAVAGLAAASTLDAVADLVDVMDARRGVDQLTTRRASILERNDAIRRAAARGDWAEFDRLAGGDDPSGAGGAGGSTAPGPDGGTPVDQPQPAN